jgi:hypothetical protein
MTRLNWQEWQDRDWIDKIEIGAIRLKWQD